MRSIKLSEDLAKTLSEDFYKNLISGKYTDKTVTINLFKSKKLKNKIEIRFTSLAWNKTKALLQNFGSEIGWHGVVKKESDTLFVITDILVYPQTVTPSTVKSDNSFMDCTDWYMSLDDDQINNLRMQSHSHVNMEASPSYQDEKDWLEFISGLGNDDYCIFMIWNKSLTYYARIYDLKTNTMYENDDIFVSYEKDDIEEFIDQAKNMVEFKPEMKTKNSRRLEEILDKYGIK